MLIRHYDHQDINKEKWDTAIASSHNQLFYAYSWFLDIVSPQWEAIISGDYEYLMPLPIKRKFKIPYLVQPVLTQQLGVFSKQDISAEILNEFLKNIPYSSYEMNLNEKNHFPELESRPNYLLNLNSQYCDLAKMFSKNTIRNIEKARKTGLILDQKLSSVEFLQFYESTEKNYQSVNIEIIRKLADSGMDQGMLKFWGVRSPQKELISVLCLIVTKNRITYLLPVSNSLGKKLSAMFFLVDQLISKYSSREYMLDFEGSSIEGIARFYKGFGALNHPYYVIRKFRPSFLVGRL